MKPGYQRAIKQLEDIAKLLTDNGDYKLAKRILQIAINLDEAMRHE